MMKNKLRISILFFFLLTGISLAKTNSDEILLNDSVQRYDVYRQLYWLEDAADTLHFKTVCDTTSGIKFNLNFKDEEPNLGFTNSSYWFKIKLKNDLKERKVILEIPYPFLNRLDVFIPDYRGEYHRATVGDHYPFSKREIIHKNFLFEIPFWPNEHKTIYAHISCDGEATSFPVTIWQTLALGEKDYSQQIILGFYYGILLFAIFLSLFLGISLGERSNLYYLFYIIGIGVFQLSLDGLAFEYLWPNNTWLANHIIPLAGSFAVFFLLIFTQQLLHTKKHTPQLHKLLTIIAWFDAALHFMSLFNNPWYSLSLKSLNFIALIANVTVLITAVGVFKKGYRPARYFLIAFSLLILGVLTALLKNFGFLPRVFITEYGIQIGSAIEIILISFALAERLKTLKEEKQIVQELLLDQLQENNRSQKEQNIILEKKVKTRTFEIEQQNKIIADKNKDITDSINYAKRIQEAILPKGVIQGLNEQNSFIYFKPRDIVSGDFYWYTEKNNTTIIAAVDCTGHGVPGAFMSMIGTTLLNKVVNDEGEIFPSKILQQLDKSVVESLQQKGVAASSNDGMDMALCSINFDTQQILFCGASRPLYLVRNQHLIEYKSSPLSIGGFVDGNAKVFEDIVIPYQKGDSFYMFTDGYCDQFGGGDDKKFMSKRLKELCVEMAPITAAEQKQKLHTTLINWMGRGRQKDDILVIGFKM